MSTYVPIATQTLGSAASNVTFSSLPQNYTDLIIVSSNKNTANNGDEVGIQFNGDTSSNYSRTRLYGNGSSRAADRSSNTNKGALQINSTSNFTPLIAHVQNYSNSTTYKTIISRGNSDGYVSAYASLWRNKNPITQITLLPDSGTTFTSGSTFTIYGIAAGNISAKATGGNIVVTDGSYWYHAFTTSGIFTPSEALTCDYLVVAGGGGGGHIGNGGGGGAGGLRSTLNATGGGGSLESPLSLSSNLEYPVLVGAGGASVRLAYSSNGGDSTFASITSVGGGRGGASAENGQLGGSGGGASPGGYAGGARTVNQGYAGGNAGGYGSPAYGGGGGGGAGAAGTAGDSNNAGNGGAGVAITALASITGTGISTYYAGGGGGGHNDGGGGSAGAGGGGTGGYRSNEAVAGKANTGGGGGGAGNANNTGDGLCKPGGSGIVIIRYAV